MNSKIIKCLKELKKELPKRATSEPEYSSTSNYNYESRTTYDIHDILDDVFKHFFNITEEDLK